MPEREPRPIRYEDVDALVFDPSNPRLPDSIDGSDEEQVLSWMLDDASLTDLMQSIASQGFFDGEPMLVVGRGDGTYEVIEGNRRLAACKLLLHPASAPRRPRTVSDIAEEAEHRPDVVPVVEFESREEVLDYLGYRHVTGIKPWEPLAKARYVETMWHRLEPEIEDEDERLLRIARLIGSGRRTDYVAQMLTALGLYRRLVGIGVIGDEVDEADVDFSLLTVALMRKEIPLWLGLDSGRDFHMEDLDEERLGMLGRWLFARDDENETVLGDSRNMTKLAAVVDDEDALVTLKRTSDLEMAASHTDYASADLIGNLKQARESLYAALEQSARVDDFDPDDLDIIVEIRRIAKRLYDAVHAAAIDDLDDELE